jgi:hypothetical protein
MSYSITFAHKLQGVLKDFTRINSKAAKALSVPYKQA